MVFINGIVHVNIHPILADDVRIPTEWYVNRALSLNDGKYSEKGQLQKPELQLWKEEIIEVNIGITIGELLGKLGFENIDLVVLNQGILTSKDSIVKPGSTIEIWPPLSGG